MKIKKILTIGLTEKQYDVLTKFQREISKKGFTVTRQNIFSRAFEIGLKEIEKELIESEKTDCGLN
jgi:hypothetical protein